MSDTAIIIETEADFFGFCGEVEPIIITKRSDGIFIERKKFPDWGETKAEAMYNGIQLRFTTKWGRFIVIDELHDRPYSIKKMFELLK